MRIHLGTDHAGLEFSTQVQQHLAEQGHEVIDHGPLEYDPLDDYPAFCIRAAQAVIADQEAGLDALGVIFGGSGNGEQIAANKVRGIRAALVWNTETAELARQHNDANICSIGARQHTWEEAVGLIDAFLTTPFSGEERHVRRIREILAFEQDGTLLPDPRATASAREPTASIPEPVGGPPPTPVPEPVEGPPPTPVPEPVEGPPPTVVPDVVAAESSSFDPEGG